MEHQAKVNVYMTLSHANIIKLIYGHTESSACEKVNKYLQNKVNVQLISVSLIYSLFQKQHNEAMAAKLLLHRSMEEVWTYLWTYYHQHQYK